MASGIEREIKLRIPGAAAAREALARLGATLQRPRQLEDNVLFDDAQSSLRRTGRSLRVRRTGERGLVTFKGPRSDSEGVKSRPEIEAEVGDPAALRAVLEAVGFRAVFRYQKQREVYRWKDAEIVVDETPIGVFVEIEGPLSAIHEAASALGYGPSDYIRDSYADLFFASGGRGDMVFDER